MGRTNVCCIAVSSLSISASSLMSAGRARLCLCDEGFLFDDKRTLRVVDRINKVDGKSRLLIS
jgi:hypothetical protein